jgi:iron uptake system EfeUOB component EfeO/EfeM
MATVAVVGVIVVVSSIVALKGGSSTARDAGAPASPVAEPTPLAHYVERAPHVASQILVYGVQGGVQGAAATPPPELVPISARAFRRPIARYLAYSGRQLTRMRADIARLRDALAEGSRARAQRAWLAAYADYLRFGAVYLEGRLGTLDRQIDGTAGGLARDTSSPRFTGLHRLELELWTGASLRSLEPRVAELRTHVIELQRILPSVRISPLDYATRAHEILEDAVRDQLSGIDARWSGAGVLGTAAGVAATTEVLKTLAPVLGQREGVLVTVDADLHGLRTTLASIERIHGGSLPTNAQLTQFESERLDAAIGQALEGLAQVPGALETANAADPPAIPAADARTDP